VLDVAADPACAAERVKLRIVASNLDEFYAVRVAGLPPRSNVADGRTPART
jgi:polyphosphate kinase